MQMLIDYKPWGRPGGGAPRDERDNRRTKKMELKELNKGEDMVRLWSFSFIVTLVLYCIQNDSCGFGITPMLKEEDLICSAMVFL